MASKRALNINIGLLLLGIIIAGLWIYISGGAGYFSRLLLVRPGYFTLLFGITAFCILSRFVRWQFLLRSINIRIPTKSSLSIFLASLFGILTPAYVGELVRGWFLQRKFGTPMKISTSVWVMERLLDMTALAVIGLVTANVLWVRIVMLIIIVGSWALGFVGSKFLRYFDISQNFTKTIFSMRILLFSFIMSLIAWLPTAMLISVAAAAMENWINPFIGMHIYSTATILGGISLMPAGVGAMGSTAILQLQNLGIDLNDSIAIVSIVRLTSTGASLAVASVFLFVELIILKPNLVGIKANHFNKIALQYKDQFSQHVWDHLLKRKMKMITEVLPNPLEADIGLDLGCGLGDQCLELGKYGYSLIGVDSASNLVHQAQNAGVTARLGSAQALPFEDSYFGFVYTVGVLHHLSGQKERTEAFCEIKRVLRPGGLFIVHETNPRNPIFRFYMGYIFPILKNIDEGTEKWIGPTHWSDMDGMKLIDLKYFTFMPDFIPKWLMGLAAKLEKWLEASALRSYSVHYMAVLQKEPR